MIKQVDDDKKINSSVLYTVETLDDSDILQVVPVFSVSLAKTLICIKASDICYKDKPIFCLLEIPS